MGFVRSALKNWCWITVNQDNDDVIDHIVNETDHHILCFPKAAVILSILRKFKVKMSTQSNVMVC